MRSYFVAVVSNGWRQSVATSCCMSQPSGSTTQKLAGTIFSSLLVAGSEPQRPAHTMGRLCSASTICQHSQCGSCGCTAIASTCPLPQSRSGTQHSYCQISPKKMFRMECCRSRTAWHPLAFLEVHLVSGRCDRKR